MTTPSRPAGSRRRRRRCGGRPSTRPSAPSPRGPSSWSAPSTSRVGVALAAPGPDPGAPVRAGPHRPRLAPGQPARRQRRQPAARADRRAGPRGPAADDAAGVRATPGRPADRPARDPTTTTEDPMPTVPSPQTVLDRVRRDVERNALRARNGIKLVAGVDRPGVGPDPEGRRLAARPHPALALPERPRDLRRGPLRAAAADRVQPDQPQLHPRPDPGNSFVEQLLEAGFDVYMLDWGEPDERDAENRLEDYVDDYIPAGIDRVLELSGADEVNLFGYCFGGDLTLLYAAHHPDAPLRSLTVLATPVDFRHMGPLADIFTRRRAWTSTRCSTPTATSRRSRRPGLPVADPDRGGHPLRDPVGAALERRVRRLLPGDDRLVRRPRPLPRRRRAADGGDAGPRQRHGERPADRRRRPRAPGRHPGPVPHRAGQPGPHRARRRRRRR